MQQIVFVKWGRKYGPRYINGLVRAISSRTSGEVRFVCITDEPGGLDPIVDAVPFPEFGVPLNELTGRIGCLPKLAMFAPGMLRPGLKTLYLDIDTAVLGDVAQLTGLLDRHPNLHALPNHFVPHWRTPWLSWIVPEGNFFINSSAIAFWPERHHDIFADFCRDYPAIHASGLAPQKMPLQFFSDERYVSWHEKGRLRAFPRRLAGSFKDLYMTPWAGLSAWIGERRLVRRRRANRVVLTFHGAAVKPEKLVDMNIGDLVEIGSLKTRWDYPEFTEYWKEILNARDP